MSRLTLKLDPDHPGVKLPRDAQDVRRAWKLVEAVAAAPGAELELGDVLAPARIRRYPGHRAGARRRFAA